MPTASNVLCGCGRFMVVVKNSSVTVEEQLEDGAPYKLWDADLYACPDCGAEVITGFGRAADAQAGGGTKVMTKDYKPKLLVMVPRRVHQRYWPLPWADVVAAAERGNDGLMLLSEPPRRWQGLAGEPDPEIVDVAFYREGQCDWKGRTLLYQQNWNLHVPAPATDADA